MGGKDIGLGREEKYRETVQGDHRSRWCARTVHTKKAAIQNNAMRCEGK